MPQPSSAEPSARPFGAAAPGSIPYDQRLLDEIKDAWEARPDGYEPRTRHRDPSGGPLFTNRLFLESSPYLRQHAHNPVNWYPWGDEAFAAAREFGRPVFLSVGYSTCHWCHVMEEESFEDLEIARYINENFIAIKVDREERPDVDAIYMAALHAMGQRGGWPMTVFLNGERQPFFGGTYFPARDGDRGAGTGFFTLLHQMKQLYVDDPARVAKAGADLARILRNNMKPVASSGSPTAAALSTAMERYKARFDPRWGGLRGQHKFPSSLPIRLLLRQHRRTGDEALLGMATLTLEKMAAGGMYDQAAGGFHRYSTDGRWLVPHFEKMLYDNALLVLAYLDAYQASGREDFAQVAREILRYVQRDMTSPEGAFYSATDADSIGPGGEREEGYYFTWTPTELDALLGTERARIVAAYYGVNERGNFEGRSILNVSRGADVVASELGVTVGSLKATIAEARELLYTERQSRPAPIRDDKILTAWNGLMISAYARAAQVLGQPEYAERAARAAAFLLENARVDGRLRRSFKDGQARHNGYLDDYASLIAALIDLFEASGEPRWIREAIALDQVLEQHYEDPAGGFFMTSDDHEALLVREKPSSDGAEPAGNSVAVMNLLRLHELTSDDHYRQRAERCFKAFAGVLERAPMALAEMLLALDFHLDRPKEVVIITPGPRALAEPLLAELRRSFLPNHVLAVVRDGAPRDALATLVPLVEGKGAIDGKATAYVCRLGLCERPTSDPAVLRELLLAP